MKLGSLFQSERPSVFWVARPYAGAMDLADAPGVRGAAWLWPEA